MKFYLTISLTVLCLFLTKRLDASTNDASKKAGTTETAAKENGSEKKVNETDEATLNDQKAIPSGATQYLMHEPDSANLNSLCKFNFIFYFIYKLKYDEQPAGYEHLEYGL